MPGPYSAGSVFLQVVPSFANVQTLIRSEAQAIGRALGKELGDAFDKEVDRSVGKSLEDALGGQKGERAARDSGKKAGTEYGGAFRSSVRTALQNSLRDLGKDVDVGVEDLGKRLKKLAKTSIKPRMDSSALAADVAKLQAELTAAQKNMDLSLEARVNAAKMADDLAKVRAMVDAVAEKPAEIEIQPRLGGAFETEIQARIKALAAALPRLNLDVDADVSEASAQLAALKLRAEQLGDQRIGIDVSAAEALLQIQEIEAALATLSERTDVDVDVHMNAVQALAQARLVFENIEKTFAKPVEVEVSTQEATRNLGLFAANARAVLAAALQDLPDVEIDADSSRADQEIAGLRARMSALSEQIDLGLDSDEVYAEIAFLRSQLAALGSSGDLDLDVDVDTASAQARFDAFLARNKRREVEVNVDLDTGAATAKMTLLSRIFGSLGSRQAGDEANIAANSFRGFNGVLLATASIGPLLVPALAAVAGGLTLVGTSAIGAGAALAPLIIGLTGIGDAVGALGDVQNNAQKDATSYAKTMRTAANSVRDAQQGLDRAREAAAEAAESSERRVRDALRSQTDAEKDLQRAQRDARRAQEELQRAREDAADQLVDLSFKVRGGALAERQAVIDLFEAQVAYNNAMADPGATRLEREQAAIAYERASLALEEQRKQNADLAKEQSAATAASIDGSDAVVTAQQRVEDANERVADAQQGVVDAAEGVQDAIVAQTRSARDSARAIQDATERLSDAQANYADALTNTGDIGSSSMQKLEQAMGKLGPAGQAFAYFIFGLKDEFYTLRDLAQEGFLPGVQDGIQQLLDVYGPALQGFFATTGTLLGDLSRQTADWLTGPAMSGFFSTMEDYNPTFLQQWFDISTSLGDAFASILTVAAPFAAAFGDILVSMSQAFAEWAASPEGVELMQEFFGYVVDIAPEVFELIGALIGAFINVGEALAPYAGVLLDAFTGILNFIADMDPTLLGVIIGALITLTLVFQGLFAIGQSAGGLIAAVGVLAEYVLPALGTAIGAISGPVGWVVLAIAALVAGFVWLWNTSDGFRGFWKDLWADIQDAAGAVADWWTGTLVPLAEETWGALTRGWEGFASAAQWVWDEVLGPIFSAIGGAFTFIGTVFGLVWSTVLSPVINAFGTVFGWIWTNILGPTFGFIGDAFELLGTIIWWVWSEVVGPVWELLGAVIKAVWENTLGPVFSWIGDAWRGMSDVISTFWNENIRPIFEALGGFISEHVAPIFQAGVEAIGTIWQGLLDWLKTPVEFVVDTIINGALIDNFNKLADIFGTSHIEHLQLPDSWSDKPAAPGGGGGSRMQMRATGGEIFGSSPTPTADNIPIWATAGEFMQPVSSVDYYGMDVMEAIRRRLIPREAFSMMGFASGGLIDFGKYLQGLGFKVTEHPAFGGVTPGAHMRGSKHYSGNAIDVNWAPGTSAAEQQAIDAIVPIASQYGLGTIWRVKNHFNHAHFENSSYNNIGTGGGGKSIAEKIGSFIENVAGTAYDLATDPVGFLRASVQNVIEEAGSNPMMSLLAGFPLKAIDAAAGWIGDHFGIGDNNSAKPTSNPDQKFANGGIIPTHLYDSGGIIPPGLTGVLNLTGGDERQAVFTTEQWAALQQLADSDGGTGDVYDIDLTGVPMDQADEIVSQLLFALRTARRGGVYNRKGAGV